MNATSSRPSRPATKRAVAAGFVLPLTTVDVVIFSVLDGQLRVLQVQRPHDAGEPFPGRWALPGGFVEYGESLEDAAVRECREETGLRLSGLRQFHTYSRPDRDPRIHTISTVFAARGRGIPRAADDALDLGIFPRSGLPGPLAFDHAAILADWFAEEQPPSSKVKEF